MITSIYIEHLNKQHKLVSNWLEYYRECRMKGFKHNKLNAEQLKDDAENGIKHRAKVVNYLLFLERELELSQISKTILKIK